MDALFAETPPNDVVLEIVEGHSAPGDPIASPVEETVYTHHTLHRPGVHDCLQHQRVVCVDIEGELLVSSPAIRDLSGADLLNESVERGPSGLRVSQGCVANPSISTHEGLQNFRFKLVHAEGLLMGFEVAATLGRVYVRGTRWRLGPSACALRTRQDERRKNENCGASGHCLGLWTSVEPVTFTPSIVLQIQFQNHLLEQPRFAGIWRVSDETESLFGGGERRSRRKKRGREETPERLKEAALRYLGQRETSVDRLRTVLLRRVDRSVRRFGSDPEPLKQAVEETVEYCRRIGYVDDQRFSEMKSRSMQKAGKSRRKIAQTLRSYGVDRDLIESSTEDQDELQTARVFVRKKRLLRHLEGIETLPRMEQMKAKRKALASLARQGFGYDIASRALELEASGENE